MAILQQQRTGYNPQADVHLEKLSWKLMDLHYGGIPRYAVLDRVADAVHQIQAAAAVRINPDDLPAFWQTLRGLPVRAGRRADGGPDSENPDPGPANHDDDAELYGADIPFLVTA